MAAEPSTVGPRPVRAASTDDELTRLRQLEQALKAELEVAAMRIKALSSPKLNHLRTVSRLASGLEVAISEPELEAMRAIFNLFDHGTGRVSPGDLKALHQKLGEPITDEEARDAVREIGQGRDFISFNDFLAYWDGSHPSLTAPLARAELSGHAAIAPAVSLGSDSDGVPALDIGTTADATARAMQKARRRQWTQARFKFLRAKLASPVVGRIYTEEAGACPSLEYRVHFYYDAEDGHKVQISPWHDIPYKNPDGTYNMLVEIPKWTRRKYEISTGELGNPIKQDTKNGVLREYLWGDQLFNYGAIPQTWEDPRKRNPVTGTLGDNDPIDVVDIGSKQWGVGSVVAVKVLGVLAMIDAGETDWKLIAINVEDPLAALLHDIEDVRVHLPGAVDALHHWLKYYKTPVVNEFGFGGAPQGRRFSEALVEETHADWQKLVEERGGTATVTKAEAAPEAAAAAAAE